MTVVSPEANGNTRSALRSTQISNMLQERLRVLVIGNGGREHALAWKLSQSPLVDAVYVAPGNGGTSMNPLSKIQNANVRIDDYAGLVTLAQRNGVNLVVPGPEAPLVDGIQGYFQAGEHQFAIQDPSQT
jgi:phosphoribosylamine--glycine ligase/phosphoribosylformylglycinamidine cyclo-ligase